MLVNVEEIGDHRVAVTDGATDSRACRVPERHLILPQAGPVALAEDPGAAAGCGAAAVNLSQSTGA